MKPNPGHSLILLLSQILIVTFIGITEFFQYLFILIILTLIITGFKEGLVRWLKHELRLAFLFLFIILMYSFFDKFPEIAFSQSGFLTAVSISMRIFLVIGFISLYFGIYSFESITSELLAISEKMNEKSFANEFLRLLSLSLLLFNPLLETARAGIDNEKKYQNRSKKLGDRMFFFFLKILDRAESEYSGYQSTGEKVEQIKNRYSTGALLFWVPVLIVLNLVIFFTSDYLYKLKGIF